MDIAVLGVDRIESVEAQLPEGEDLPDEEGLDLRGWCKLALFAVLAGVLICLLLGFIRYFWVQQYGGLAKPS